MFGRLGDLGAVDKKYDAAVSNSAGGLDSIVVDTVTTAQKCIAYLRQHNLGRSAFLNLEMQVRRTYTCAGSCVCDRSTAARTFV